MRTKYEILLMKSRKEIQKFETIGQVIRKWTKIQV